MSILEIKGTKLCPRHRSWNFHKYRFPYIKLKPLIVHGLVKQCPDWQVIAVNIHNYINNENNNTWDLNAENIFFNDCLKFYWWWFQIGAYTKALPQPIMKIYTDTYYMYIFKSIYFVILFPHQVRWVYNDRGSRERLTKLRETWLTYNALWSWDAYSSVLSHTCKSFKSIFRRILLCIVKKTTNERKKWINDYILYTVLSHTVDYCQKTQDIH